MGRVGEPTVLNEDKGLCPENKEVQKRAQCLLPTKLILLHYLIKTMKSSQLVFKKISVLALKMSWHAKNCTRSQDTDFKDFSMNEIIEISEKIEQLYSNNWH